LFYKIKVFLNVYLVVNQILKNLAFWMLVFSYGSSLTIVTKCNQNLGHVFFLVTQLLKMHINAWPLRILTFIFQNMLYLMKLSFLSLSLYYYVISYNFRLDFIWLHHIGNSTSWTNTFPASACDDCCSCCSFTRPPLTNSSPPIWATR